mmetsp:Transcript_14372/g.30332  ORF Transcript_14372/g.30332 Transcript_14372/m.30332 type:complete len:366 (+) Transcript_14372:154-1251(+)
MHAHGKAGLHPIAALKTLNYLSLRFMEEQGSFPSCVLNFCNAVSASQQSVTFTMNLVHGCSGFEASLYLELRDRVHIVVRLDFILRAEQLLLRGNAAEREAALEAVVLSEENVRVKAVADHANPIALDAVLLHHVVDHQRARLADERGLAVGAPLDGAGHGAVARPLLRVGQVRHRVQVCHDELTARVFVDAKLRVLDLVVIDVAVEADDDGADVLIVRQRVAGLELHLLVGVGGAADVRHADEVELLLDANLSDNVHLLPSLLELGLLEVRRRREGRREDLLGLNVEPKRRELAEVALTALGRVVCHEEHLLASLAQHVEHRRNAINHGVALPNDTVTVKNEDVGVVKQLRRHFQLGAETLLLQ